uniref:ORM1-like protein 3 n=1 Tax=Hanusia phi TaxID=3032 RepID=A0A7S0F517_9CRYP|mmetsp:Transcript_3818/g.9450  ORF Transcript_3818/g.9450 Transcript_3818/m.9450 type:complete len:177 (+) Transcript_3818:121-651(+)
MDGSKDLNYNVDWINDRGTWWFYLLMLGLSRWCCFLAGVNEEWSWSFVLISHSIITFWLVHWKTGSLLTWEDDSGKYDGMTYWEQIDDGVENTGNRKFLRIVPLVLFLLAYRYSTGALTYVNLSFTLLVLVPKIRPFRQRAKRSSGSFEGIIKQAGFRSNNSQHRRGGSWGGDKSD